MSQKATPQSVSASSRFGWRHLLLALWVIGIVVAYYAYHPVMLGCPGDSLLTCPARAVPGHTIAFYSSALWNGLLFVGSAPKAFLFYVLAALYLCVALWKRFRGTRTMSVTLTPVLLFGVTALWIMIALNAFLFLHGRNNHMKIPWGVAELSIIEKWGTVVLALAVLSFVVCVIGDAVIRKAKLSTTTVSTGELWFLKFGTGSVVLSLLMFLLGIGGLLSPVPVAIMLAFVCILLWKSAGIVSQFLFRERFTFTWHSFSLEAFAWCAIVGMLAVQSVDLLQPIPTGWDAMFRYINTPRLLADRHSLITGVNAYPIELLMSIGTVLWKSIPATQWTAAFLGLLGTGGIYLIARRFSNTAIASILAAVYFLNPVVLYQMSWEVKIDPPLILFACVTLLGFLIYLETSSRTEHTADARRWLIFTALLAGFCFTAKYTSIFLIVSLTGTLAWHLIRTMKLPIRHALGTLVLFGALTALPFIPWGAKFIADAHGDVNLFTIQRGAVPGPLLSCAYDENTSLLLTDPATGESLVAVDDALPARPTGSEEELGRYWGYDERGALKYLLLPWQVTMNTTVNAIPNQINYSYLALLVPLLILFYRRGTTSNGALARWTLLYWILWALLARGIIWYGLPGFIGLTALCASLLSARWHDRGIRYIASAVMVLSLVGMFFLRLSLLSSPETYAYWSGMAPAKYFIDETFPNYGIAATVINTDQPTPEEKKYVYRIGTFIPFLIENNDLRLLNDDQLDLFSCIVQKNNGDVAAVITTLKEAGFKYIVLSPDVAGIDLTPGQTLRAKTKQMAAVINEASKQGLVKPLVNGLRQASKILLLEIL